MDKARSTLKQFVRDWSADVIPWGSKTNSHQGARERELCYGTVLDALEAKYANLSIEERFYHL
jgi:N2227-like protein